MMTKGIIITAAAFMFALTLGILTAQSGNDRASSPTIPHACVAILGDWLRAARAAVGSAAHERLWRW